MKHTNFFSYFFAEVFGADPACPDCECERFAPLPPKPGERDRAYCHRCTNLDDEHDILVALHPNWSYSARQVYIAELTRAWRANPVSTRGPRSKTPPTRALVVNANDELNAAIKKAGIRHSTAMRVLSLLQRVCKVEDVTPQEVMDYALGVTLGAELLAAALAPRPKKRLRRG